MGWANSIVHGAYQADSLSRVLTGKPLHETGSALSCKLTGYGCPPDKRHHHAYLYSGSDQNPVTTRAVTRALPRKVFSKPPAHSNKKTTPSKKKTFKKTAPKKYKRKK